MYLAALLLLLFVAKPSQAAFPICLVQNPGFANCDPSASSGTYNGFDVDLIRYVASLSNWSELVGFPPFDDNTTVYSRHFYFVCVPFRVAPLINIIVGNNTMDQCAMGAGALTITAARWQSGVTFSYPFFRTGLGVMISTQPQVTVYNPWAFLRPFHWSIWVALIVNLVSIPFLVWLIENLVRTGSIPFHRDSLEDIGFAIYTTILTVFNLEVVRLLTIPAQAIIVCFCFMNLVMVATYTANLAAVLTTSVSSSGYQTVSDLQGTTVGAHGPYQARLAANENLNTITITWNGPSTFVNVSSFITSGGISAYIFDYPILLYWKNFYDTACKLTFLPEIEPFDYGIMFNKAFPISIQQEFNIGILTAQSSAKLAQLESKYVTVNSLCAAPSSSTTGLTGLVFYQVSGLWIIMGCAVGVGILVSIYRIVQIHCFGAEVAEYGYSEDGAGVTRRPLSFSPGTFKMTHLADAANDMASRRVWRGDSNGYDPETVGLEQNGSGPPQSSTDMEIDQATCSQPPSQIAITATAVGATAAITSQKTLSGPPGTQERSSNMAGAFRSSFARMSNAARDLAGKVLVDPNAPVRPPVGDFSVKSGRRSSRFEALPSKPSETGNPSLSPFDEADSEQDTSLGPLQVGAIGSASQRRSNPLPKVASPLGQQSSKATDALNSVDSISIPLPPVLPAPAPASAASPSPSPSLRRNEEGTGVPSLHHSRSTGRVNDFYRPKTAAAEQPRLLVNKTLEQQMADRSFRGGSPRPQN